MQGGRCGKAVGILEGADIAGPHLLSGQVERGDLTRGEDGVDTAAIGDRGWGSEGRGFVDLRWGWTVALGDFDHRRPAQRPGLGVVTEDAAFLRGCAGKKDILIPDNG